MGRNDTDNIEGTDALRAGKLLDAYYKSVTKPEDFQPAKNIVVENECKSTLLIKDIILMNAEDADKYFPFTDKGHEIESKKERKARKKASKSIVIANPSTPKKSTMKKILSLFNESSTENPGKLSSGRLMASAMITTAISLTTGDVDLNTAIAIAGLSIGAMGVYYAAKVK